MLSHIQNLDCPLASNILTDEKHIWTLLIVFSQVIAGHNQTEASTNSSTASSMTKEISARKRRRVEPAETPTRSEDTGGAVVFDDEAMKRHMLSLMQNAKNKESSEGSDSEDEEEEAEGSSDEGVGNGSEESDEDEAGSSKGAPAVVDSDEEDLDEAARALLTRRKLSNGTTEHDTQTTSRISRVPTDRKADAAPKKPVLKSTFESLGLSVQLIRTLAGISIRKPTEIQSACFEPILSGTSFHNPRWLEL